MIDSKRQLVKLCSGKKVYVYGAGKISKAVYEILYDNNINVKGFLVGKKLNNPSRLFDLDVKMIYDMQDQKQDEYIVIAVSPKFKREVINLLLNLKFNNLIIFHDRYLWELNSYIDTRTKCVALFGGTDYKVIFYDGVELNHGIIIERKEQSERKWRLDLATVAFDKYGKLTKFLSDGKLTKKFENEWGRYNFLPYRVCNGEPLMKFNDTVIYKIRCHVDKPLEEDNEENYFTEIQAGAVLTDVRLCKITDSIGNNISERNYNFSECSAIYWAWKNGMGNRYTGIAHYRRELKVSSADIRYVLDRDVTLINTIPCVLGITVEQFFIRIIYENDWKLMMDKIRDYFPEYYQTARSLSDDNIYLANNIFIMKSEWFDKMCNFVFSVLLEVDDYYRKKCILRNDRYAGYLFEFLYSVFVKHHAHEMKIMYADMRFRK